MADEIKESSPQVSSGQEKSPSRTGVRKLPTGEIAHDAEFFFRKQPEELDVDPDIKEVMEEDMHRAEHESEAIRTDERYHGGGAIPGLPFRYPRPKKK